MPFLITETWASKAIDSIKDILNDSDFLIITENIYMFFFHSHFKASLHFVIMTFNIIAIIIK